MGVKDMLKVCLQSACYVNLRDHVGGGSNNGGVGGIGIRNIDPTVDFNDRDRQRKRNAQAQSENTDSGVATKDKRRQRQQQQQCSDYSTLPTSLSTTLKTATHNLTAESIRRSVHTGRRKLLIGIDISVWICNASFAFGEQLGDERHFSNYGRATLISEQRKQQRGQGQQCQNDLLDGRQNDQATTEAATGLVGATYPPKAASAPPTTMTTTMTTTMPLRDRSPTSEAEAILAQTEGYWCPSTTQVSEAMKTFDPNVQSYINDCVGYVMKRLKVLRDALDGGANIMVVMDGITPPIKRKESNKRRSKQKEYERRRDEPVFDFYRHYPQGQQGDKDENIVDHDDDNHEAHRRQIEAAIEQHNDQRAKSNKRAGAGMYHPYIILALREAFRHDKISFIVAPYEADGQLAALANLGLLDLVVTEDSDLIAHGTPNVLYKSREYLSRGIPAGQLFHFNDLGCVAFNHGGDHSTGATISGGNAINIPPENLMDFTPIMMAVVFVLLGCDYYDKKLKGIGTKTAIDIVRMAFLETLPPTSSQSSGKPHQIGSCHRNSDDTTLAHSPLDRVWELAYEKSYHHESELTDDFKREYERGFVEALFMFRHPIYFHPLLGETMWANTKTKLDHDWKAKEYSWENLTTIGDPVLRRCNAYAMLCRNRVRIESITGKRFKREVSSDCAQGIWDWKKLSEKQMQVDLKRAKRADEIRRGVEKRSSNDGSLTATSALLSNLIGNKSLAKKARIDHVRGSIPSNLPRDKDIDFGDDNFVDFTNHNHRSVSTSWATSGHLNSDTVDGAVGEEPPRVEPANTNLKPQVCAGAKLPSTSSVDLHHQSEEWQQADKYLHNVQVNQATGHTVPSPSAAPVNQRSNEEHRLGKPPNGQHGQPLVLGFMPERTEASTDGDEIKTPSPSSTTRMRRRRRKKTQSSLTPNRFELTEEEQRNEAGFLEGSQCMSVMHDSTRRNGLAKDTSYLSTSNTHRDLPSLPMETGTNSTSTSDKGCDDVYHNDSGDDTVVMDAADEERYLSSDIVPNIARQRQELEEIDSDVEIFSESVVGLDEGRGVNEDDLQSRIDSDSSYDEGACHL
jgi:5'-3' exonuclease